MLPASGSTGLNIHFNASHNLVSNTLPLGPPTDPPLPEPPASVTVQMPNSTTVRVTWKPPDGSEQPMGYIVTVTEASGGEEVLRMEVGPATETLLVDVSGLDPDKVEAGQYEYSVIAVYQDGSQSEPAVGKTSGGT